MKRLIRLYPTWWRRRHGEELARLLDDLQPMSLGRRLSWAKAVGVGPNVRSIVVGDRVLFDPEDRAEVELHGKEYVLLRERDVHAVAATRVESDGTGLYL